MKLTVDHVVPTALGGSDEPSNLVTACDPCNKGKSASPADAELVADVDARAVRWAQAMQVAIERRAADLAKDRAKTGTFETEWARWTVADKPVPLAANWRNSILRFLAGGLDQAFMADAVATAMGVTKVPASDKWRYFCGICWREMDAIREMAATIADGDEETNGAQPVTDVELPLMDLFDGFLHTLVDALGGSAEEQKLADRALWQGMPAADAAYRWRLAEGATEEDDWSPFTAAKEELASYTASFMHDIEQLRIRRETRV